MSQALKYQRGHDLCIIPCQFDCQFSRMHVPVQHDAYSYNYEILPAHWKCWSGYIMLNWCHVRNTQQFAIFSVGDHPLTQLFALFKNIICYLKISN